MGHLGGGGNRKARRINNRQLDKNKKKKKFNWEKDQGTWLIPRDRGAGIWQPKCSQLHMGPRGEEY